MIIEYRKQKLLIWYVVITDSIIFLLIMIDNNAKIDGNFNFEFYFFLYDNIFLCVWYKNISY